MRCDDEADVARAFERLRSQTEAYVFSQVGRITLSVGLSEVQPGGSPSVAIERADHAMNLVKVESWSRGAGSSLFQLGKGNPTAVK